MLVKYESKVVIRNNGFEKTKVYHNEVNIDRPIKKYMLYSLIFHSALQFAEMDLELSSHIVSQEIIHIQLVKENDND